jgi:uncharacterized protein (DUF1499 family)
MLWLANGLIGLALVAGLAVGAGGPLYRWEWISLADAFSLMRTGAVAALAISAVGFVLLLCLLRRPEGRWRCLVALIVAAPAFLGPWSMMRTAPFRQHPKRRRLLQIGGDVVNRRHLLRGAEENPAVYPGESVARQQREAYEDIAPLMLEVPPAEAFSLARTAAGEMGWEIAAARPDEGRIEAVATTSWWGFRDDVVIRVTPAPAGSRLDIRSASRVGRSDLGKNAQRIREFRQHLRRRVDG